MSVNQYGFQEGLPTSFAQKNKDRQAIFRQRLDDVLQRTDLVELIDPLVQGGLRPQGSGFVGLCPFHNDTNPSFSVNPSMGVYRCWSCDAGLNGSPGGDAITFVRRYFNLDFAQACQALAKRLGVDLYEGFNDARQRPAQDLSVQLKPAQSRQRVVYEQEQKVYHSSDKEQIQALTVAAQAFAQQLSKDKQAQNYLFNSRGLSKSVLERFQVGAAPNEFHFLKSYFENYTVRNHALVESGLVKTTKRNPTRIFDTFRGRVTFAVRNENGQVVGFGARLVNEAPLIARDGREITLPKYLNSPESAVFKKSELLFGLYEGKKDIQRLNQAIVVEGYMDVIALANQGVPNSVACMGVAFSPKHCESILQYAKEVVLCFDGDNAGKQAAIRSIQGVLPLIGDGLKAKFLLLPDNLDPDEYLKKHGRDAFLNLVKKALSLEQFLKEVLDDAKRGFEQEKNDKEKLKIKHQTSALLRRWGEAVQKGSKLYANIKAYSEEVNTWVAESPVAKKETAPKRAKAINEGRGALNRDGLSLEQRIIFAIKLAPNRASRLKDEFAQQADDENVALQAWKDWFIEKVQSHQEKGAMTQDNPALAGFLDRVEEVIKLSALSGQLPNSVEQEQKSTLALSKRLRMSC